MLALTPVHLEKNCYCFRLNELVLLRMATMKSLCKLNRNRLLWVTECFVACTSGTSDAELSTGFPPYEVPKSCWLLATSCSAVRRFKPSKGRGLFSTSCLKIYQCLCKYRKQPVPWMPLSTCSDLICAVLGHHVVNRECQVILVSVLGSCSRDKVSVFRLLVFF